jgi:hypothetical protein
MHTFILYNITIVFETAFMCEQKSSAANFANIRVKTTAILFQLLLLRYVYVCVCHLFRESDTSPYAAQPLRYSCHLTVGF